MNSVLSRASGRRGVSRPGWTLMTALLILAIAASSALVFTSRVELLKLAVIVALWAAVAAAFVSVIYRRQSDVDQARARDLKLVYDLQLDREISARREYELTVESQLRRELASELRAQAADEVAALRTELSALRTNLEILFDADLNHRPALEQERTTVRAYSDWARMGGESDTGTGGTPAATSFYPEDRVSQTAENPIIDVPEVRIPTGGIPIQQPQSQPQPQPQPQPQSQSQPQPRQAQPPPIPQWQPDTAGSVAPGDNHLGSHRRAAEEAHRRVADEAPKPPPAAGRWAPPPQPYVGPPPPRREPETPTPPAQPQQTWGVRPATPAPAWHPVGAEGEWLPPGSPGSNWTPDASEDSGRHGAAEHSAETPSRHGRHAGSSTPADGPATADEPQRHDREGRRRAPSRHSADSPGSHTQQTQVESPAPAPIPPRPPAAAAARHSTDANDGTEAAPSTGGQSVADLLARLQPVPTERRRRRRRED
ncbi:MAG: DUF6779 domain-containing protein [Mycobacterium sp.]